MQKNKREDQKENLAENITYRILKDQVMNVLISAAIPGAGPMLNIMQKGYLKGTAQKLTKSAAVATAQELTQENPEEEESSMVDEVGLKIIMNGRGKPYG